MSETPSVTPTPTPAPAASPAPSTPSQPSPTPAIDPAAPPAPSLINQAPAAEFTPDPAKSAEENATAKTAFDAAKAPAAPPDPATIFAPIDFAKDIKLPEGFVADEVLSAEFTSIVNDKTLTRQAMAQKLIDLQAKSTTDILASSSEKGRADWETLQNDWATQTKTALGDTLPAVTARIGTLLDTYGNDEVRSILDLTGAGNHTAIVQFFDKMAIKLNESTPPLSGAPAGGGGSDDVAKRLYDKSNMR